MLHGPRALMEATFCTIIDPRKGSSISVETPLEMCDVGSDGSNMCLILLVDDDPRVFAT